ncbi:MAG: hypothetical protein JXR94_06975 [Candidatus Hydrogenedentes bacterium]|nr:hypothetical protein [Candidatus Hydrogenedentota bacterium]
MRGFNASLSIEGITADPELLELVRDAGVGTVWLACFFVGKFQQPLETVAQWKARIEAMGMGTGLINIPLGHPRFTERQPDYMPQIDADEWKLGVRPDGRVYGGVSLHPPATAQNVAGLRQIKRVDPGIVFLDDDFRLAPSPDDIGGCFCDEHKAAFLQKNGYAETRWAELLDDVNNRRFTPLLRAWVTDACDELTACFRAQQEAAAPEIELGNMIMYMGSERAGIRLADYAGVPFRVGELMFNDESFAPLKGKTNELFSALFHRRYAAPERAYSETTAWPPDKLSAPNMAAKLVISTIADVRNTMFMSGLTPFPRTHWQTLAPAMRKQAAFHEKLAGHVPRGPFKHYWGERSRWVGDSNGYSLFLALGVPFEITGEPAGELAGDGWTFLSNFDAQAVQAGEIRGSGTVLVHRPEAGAQIEKARVVSESFEELLAFKHEILPTLRDVPYVEEDVPAVCAWYPTARKALVWNLTAQPQDVNVRMGDTRRPIHLAALDSALIEEL